MLTECFGSKCGSPINVMFVKIIHISAHIYDIHVPVIIQMSHVCCRTYKPKFGLLENVIINLK